MENFYFIIDESGREEGADFFENHSSLTEEEFKLICSQDTTTLYFEADDWVEIRFEKITVKSAKELIDVLRKEDFSFDQDELKHINIMTEEELKKKVEK